MAAAFPEVVSYDLGVWHSRWRRKHKNCFDLENKYENIESDSENEQDFHRNDPCDDLRVQLEGFLRQSYDQQVERFLLCMK